MGATVDVQALRTALAAEPGTAFELGDIPGSGGCADEIFREQNDRRYA